MKREDQFIVRMPDGLRDEIKTEAKANGRSMNTEMVRRLMTFTSQDNLLDWFAGQALSGMFADGTTTNGSTFRAVAHEAYAMADTMLEVRKAMLAARRGGDE